MTGAAPVQCLREQQLSQGAGQHGRRHHAVPQERQQLRLRLCSGLFRCCIMSSPLMSEASETIPVPKLPRRPLDLCHPQHVSAAVGALVPVHSHQVLLF